MQPAGRGFHTPDTCAAHGYRLIFCPFHAFCLSVSFTVSGLETRIYSGDKNWSPFSQCICILTDLFLLRVQGESKTLQKAPRPRTHCFVGNCCGQWMANRQKQCSLLAQTPKSLNEFPEPWQSCLLVNKVQSDTSMGNYKWDLSSPCVQDVEWMLKLVVYAPWPAALFLSTKLNKATAVWWYKVALTDFGGCTLASERIEYCGRVMSHRGGVENKSHAYLLTLPSFPQAYTRPGWY